MNTKEDMIQLLDFFLYTVEDAIKALEDDPGSELMSLEFGMSKNDGQPISMEDLENRRQLFEDIKATLIMSPTILVQ